MRSDANGVDGAFVHGVLLEGTFLKDKAYAGAQNPEHFRAPDPDLYGTRGEGGEDGGSRCHGSQTSSHDG